MPALKNVRQENRRAFRSLRENLPCAHSGRSDTSLQFIPPQSRRRDALRLTLTIQSILNRKACCLNKAADGIMSTLITHFQPQDSAAKVDP